MRIPAAAAAEFLLFIVSLSKPQWGGGNKQAGRSGWQRKDQQPELALCVWPGAWQDRK